MGPDGVLATESLTGAAYYDQARLKQAIETAKTQSDYVWVDTQLWPEYGTTPGGDQVSVSQEAINYGADIVTGVSSHELQGAANYNGKLVFYGLGNFFFDQMLELESRQGIALRAYMYDGKVRSIEILPTMMFNNCQPRFLEGSEKERLLNYFLDISTL
jgi:poly-gamma-glutamate synthesis protein (capsule biosynthesis protein)